MALKILIFSIFLFSIVSCKSTTHSTYVACGDVEEAELGYHSSGEGFSIVDESGNTVSVSDNTIQIESSYLENMEITILEDATTTDTYTPDLDTTYYPLSRLTVLRWSEDGEEIELRLERPSHEETTPVLNDPNQIEDWDLQKDDDYNDVMTLTYQTGSGRQRTLAGTLVYDAVFGTIDLAEYTCDESCTETYSFLECGFGDDYICGDLDCEYDCDNSLSGDSALGASDLPPCAINDISFASPVSPVTSFTVELETP